MRKGWLKAIYLIHINDTKIKRNQSIRGQSLHKPINNILWVFSVISMSSKKHILLHTKCLWFKCCQNKPRPNITRWYGLKNCSGRLMGSCYGNMPHASQSVHPNEVTPCHFLICPPKSPHSLVSHEEKSPTKELKYWRNVYLDKPDCCCCGVLAKAGLCPWALDPGPTAFMLGWGCGWGWPVSLDKIPRSDICRRWATGGMRASVAGNRLTSDFMSLKSSSNWLSTVRIIIKICQYT